MLKELVASNRSCRRFYQEEKVGLETLRELVDLARISPSASNKQPLKYFLSADPEKNAVIFSHLGWAGHFKNWRPPEGERPSAYILILLDKEISDSVICDQGIAAQTILLGAREKGLAGCMHASVKKQELCQVLGIAPRCDILLAVSIGKPKEKVVIETLTPDGDFRYWRDETGVHHVPKRRLEDIIIS